MFVMTLAFLGIGVYTIVGGAYVVRGAVRCQKAVLTRREMMALIPSPIRKFGNICIMVFLGGLAVLGLLSLSARILP